MKTRVDFVSNSSSCSFVVACQRDCLPSILKDLSKACCNPKDPYHNKDLAKRNFRILDFCVNAFQLAFLGELLLETKEEKYSLEVFKNMWRGVEVGEKEWEKYKKDLMRMQSGKEAPWWMKRAYGDDKYDPKTDTATHYEKVYVNDVVVSNSIMESALSRYHFDDNKPDPEDIVQRRVESLVELAKEKYAQQYGRRPAVSFSENVEVYQITKDTVDNTRELIDHGYTVDLEEWEDLDMLDDKLACGNAIFYVRIANSGDGYGDFYIFSEDNADGLDGVSGIEVLTSESL